MDHVAALAYLDRHINLEATAAVAGRVEDLSLEPMRRLAEVLGDPQRAYPVIHITGTNGKGSVARMISRLLVASGLSVGTYTSPHLERVNERIAWNGEPIDDEDFARMIGDLEAVEPVVGVPVSYFELLTAAAFAYFAEVAVDVAVVEVGLLGRWDATNVADGEVAVITNVGGDHTDFADGWRRSVAEEKAGVVKAGATVIVGDTDPDVVDTITKVATDVGAREVWRLGHEFAEVGSGLAVGGRIVDVRTPGQHLDEVFLPVHGAHQGTNAVLAVAAAEAFFGRPLDVDVIREAFFDLTLPGRLEVISRQPLVIIDGAHNREGAAAIASAVDDGFATTGMGLARRILVVGMLGGRDPVAFLEAIGVGEWDRVIACTAPSTRGIPARELAGSISELGVVAEIIPDPATAVRQAIDRASVDDLVLVTGSLYLVGAVRSLLR